MVKLKLENIGQIKLLEFKISKLCFSLLNLLESLSYCILNFQPYGNKKPK